MKSDPVIFIWLGEDRYTLNSWAEVDTNFGIKSNDDCFCSGLVRKFRENYDALVMWSRVDQPIKNVNYSIAAF